MTKLKIQNCPQISTSEIAPTEPLRPKTCRQTVLVLSINDVLTNSNKKPKVIVNLIDKTTNELELDPLYISQRVLASTVIVVIRKLFCNFFYISRMLIR